MSFPPLADLLFTLPLGAALGFFGGLFGIGGGIVAIPVLVLGFGLEQPLAQGTALVMMVPNLLVGWWRYSRRHPVSLGTALAIGGVAAVTTWLAAGIATGLPPGVLKALFAGFLLLLALRLLVASRRPSPAEGDAGARQRLLPLVGVAGGSCMGLLGIGGGLVATPLFTTCFGLRQAVAQGLALALVAPSSAVALAAYAGAGRVDWPLGLALAASGLFTVSAGVAVAHRLPERRMRTAFALVMLAAALWLLLAPLFLA